jgi:hypothetical protein
MLQAHGIGSLRANMVLTSWFEDDCDREKAVDHGSMIHTAIRHGCNVGIVQTPDAGWSRVFHAAGRSKGRSIRVWWSDDHTGQLLTMLAWMCTRTSTWADAAIEVLVESDDTADRQRVATLIDEARLPATVVGLASPSEFNRLNRSADLVFAPVRVRHGQPLGPGDRPLEALLPELGVAVFAHAATPFELDVQPDDTDLAAVAVAHDRASELSARADQLSQEAATLLVTAELARIDAQSGRVPNPEVVATAETAARQAQRTYVDARTRADEAWRSIP